MSRAAAGAKRVAFLLGLVLKALYPADNHAWPEDDGPEEE